MNRTMNPLLLLIILFSHSPAQGLLFHKLETGDCLLDLFSDSPVAAVFAGSRTLVELGPAGLHSAVIPKLKGSPISSIPDRDRVLAGQLHEIYSPTGHVGIILFAHFTGRPAEQSAASTLPFDLAITQRGDRRWGFRFTQVNQTDIPSFDLTPLADKLNELHRQKVWARLNNEGFSGPELEAELTVQAGIPLGSAEHQPAGGIEVPPEQILLETYRFLAAEYRRRDLRYGK